MVMIISYHAQTVQHWCSFKIYNHICVSDKPKHVIESIASSPYITEKNTKPLPVSRADSHYTTGEDTVTDINMG